MSNNQRPQQPDLPNNQRPQQPDLQIISGHSSPICRFAEDPRTSCLFAARALPFFAGHHRITEAGPIGLIIASTPGACARATPFCPFLANTRGSRSSSSSVQTVYMSLNTCVYFTRTTAGRNDRVSFFPWSTKSPACTPTKAPLCSSLQQNVQPFLTQQSSSTY